jgi:hypothetical protein
MFESDEKHLPCPDSQRESDSAVIWVYAKRSWGLMVCLVQGNYTAHASNKEITDYSDNLNNVKLEVITAVSYILSIVTLYILL